MPDLGLSLPFIPSETRLHTKLLGRTISLSRPPRYIQRSIALSRGPHKFLCPRHCTWQPILCSPPRFLPSSGTRRSFSAMRGPRSVTSRRHSSMRLPTCPLPQQFVGSSVHNRRFRFVRQPHPTVGAYFGSWGAVTAFAATVTAEIVGALNPHCPRSPSDSINRAPGTEGQLLPVLSHFPPVRTFKRAAVPLHLLQR